VRLYNRLLNTSGFVIRFVVLPTNRAVGANTITHYRCHAGLQCFAMPVELGSQSQLAVIGGRAFVSSSDYRELAERFRSGDLQDLSSDKFVSQCNLSRDEADLDHAALRVAKQPASS